MGALCGRLDADPGSQWEGERVLGGRHGNRRGVGLLSVRRTHDPIIWRVGNGHVLTDADHTLIMGVVNVTPDSFSDGGQFLDPASAIAHGRSMLDAGADLLDVGGESTRPGAEPVAIGDEIDRVLPVIRALAADGALVSIDTSKAEVAAAALEAGAVIVNDVSSLADPEMSRVVAASGAGIVLMHMQGEPRTMQDDPRYSDVVEDVAASLETAAMHASSAGVAAQAVCFDPGIGFGKTLSHNLDLLSLGVERLARSGRPVLVGASRKSFVAKVVGSLEPTERDVPSAAAHVLAIAAGASIIRAHNVVVALRTARMADAIVRGIDDRT